MIVADRFEVLARAGAGGMGVVFRALDRASGVHVALKVLVDGSSEVLRFDREARVLAVLDHPSIVRHVAHGTTDRGIAWLAMEWLDGEDLGQRLARTGLDLLEAVTVAERLGQALRAAHEQGIVHRDLKPNNVFLEGGDAARARLLDFGIARRRGVDTRVATGTGVIIGTPAYMAPEQARADRDVDLRADLYSLGAVLFHSLTGVPPFEADGAMALLARVILDEAPRASSLRAELPGELDELLASLLAKTPSARPATADDVLRRLARVRRAIEALPAEVRGLPGDKVRSLALSGGEQRVFCVVLAADTARASVLPGRPAPGRADAGSEPTRATLVAEEGGAIGAAIEALSARFLASDVRIERLGESAILCVLGGASADDVIRAARAALALRVLLPTFAVVVASGRGTSTSGAPIGEIVARASARAEAELGSSPGVLLDEPVAALLEGLFVIDPSGGRLELVGERDDDEARPVLGVRTPCVGRERELAVLAATFDEVVSDQTARAIVITGPAGSGKSRLRREHRRALAARADPPHVWRARCDPASIDAPLSTIRSALRSALLDAREGGTPSHATITSRVREVATGLSDEGVGWIGRLVGLVEPDAKVDGAVAAERTRDAVVDLLRGAARRHPLVIEVEDAHWADAASLQLLDATLRESSGEALLVVAYARPELQERFPRLWADRSKDEVRLGPLGKRACERLVLKVLGDAVSPELAARLVDRANGNPFYLEELMRAERAGVAETPESILAALEVRLHALHGDLRRTLRAAAVLGERFWPGALASLVGDESRRVIASQLEELVARELVAREPTSRFSGETEHRFQHALVRDAAYGMLTADDRRLGHRLAAEWLVSMGETEPAVLGAHFERGGESRRAMEYLALAMDRAIAMGDAVAAAALIARVDRLAADAGESSRSMIRARLALARGEVAHLEHDLRNTLAWSREALSLSRPEHEVWARAAMGVAVMAARLGDPAAVQEIERAVASITGVEHVLVDRVRGMLARQCFTTGREAEGERYLHSLRRPIEWHETNDPYTGSLLHRVLMHRASGEAHLYRRLEHGVRSLALARGTVDAVTEGFSLVALATARADLGHWGECGRLLESDSIQGQRRAAVAAVVLAASVIRGRLCSVRGDVATATEILEHTVARYEAAGDRRRRLQARTVLAEILLDADARAEQSFLESGMPEFAADLETRSHYAYVRARYAMAQGRLGEARELALAALEGPSRYYLLAIDVGARLVLAEIEAAEGRIGSAQQARASLVEHTLARLASIPDPADRDQTRAGLAEVRLILAGAEP